MANDQLKEQALELGMDIVKGGDTLQRVKTAFTTAVAIQRPRDRKKALEACLEEASIAGDEFFYSWTVKTKKGKTVLVEGLSYQAAVCEARNWGNNALSMDVEVHENYYLFKPTYIDLETGFNFQRTFMQRRNMYMGGGMEKDQDRKEDITFQIGQSKAIRNVILGAMSSWLSSKVLKQAKTMIIDKIEKEGKESAIEKLLKFFSGRGISKERIEDRLGKKRTDWSKDDVAMIYGAMNSVVQGYESAESLFPPVGQDTVDATDVRKEDLKERIKAKQQKGSKEEPKVKEKSEDKSPDDYQFKSDIQFYIDNLGAKQFQDELKQLGFSKLEEITKKQDQVRVLNYFIDNYGA